MGLGKKELVFLFCLSFRLACSRTASYREEVLVRCSGLHRDAVQKLVEGDGIDVWHVGGDGSVDFRVRSEEFQEMKGDLPECREEGSVEELVRRMEETHFNKTRQDEWFEEYHTYSEITKWYEELRSETYPHLTTFVPTIGKSVEGRDQPAFHITASEDKGVNKIYFQCQIHAREWISGATCMYMAHYLVTKYGSEERVTNLLDSVEFIFIISMNPDGYEYTWNTDRLWRKNRNPNDGTCYGVDLNRNYPYKWGEDGGSDDPCSETYQGSGPASEPEVQNTIEYFRSHMPIVGAVDWHSYGQLILRPYGWTDEDTPDEARMKEIGDQMADVLHRQYTSQKAFALYRTSGTARDWFYSEEANTLNEHRSAGYTIELRDKGQFGFFLPPSQIVPTGEEMIPAVLLFAEKLSKDPLPKPSKP